MSTSHTATHKHAVVYLPIQQLLENPKNPRVHSDQQVQQIARSIQTFGFNVPVLINGQNQIIAGHGRVKAAEQLGMTEAPTIRLEHLTPEQARAFMIADNKLTLNADWDDRLLGEHFKELSELNLDFQLGDTGFAMAEIDGLIQGLKAQPDAEDEIQTPTGPPVTVLGDLWKIGPHRLLCGNALEASAYARLMGDRKAAMVFTDPPYNVKIEGHVSGLGVVKHREFAMACGEMSASEFTDFLYKACGHLAKCSQDGSLHYLCMDWRHVGQLLEAGLSVYTEFKNLCVWAKDRAGMGSLYRSQHELVLVFKHGKASHQNNIELGKYGRARSNVWEYPSAVSLSYQSPEGNLLALHPTVKPIALVADAILDCTNRGDLILDPFLGSGTTLIAAHRVGRIGYGMELDPLYVDTALRRLQILTGLKAVHAESGRSFAEMESAAMNADITVQQECRHVESL